MLDGIFFIQVGEFGFIQFCVWQVVVDECGEFVWFGFWVDVVVDGSQLYWCGVCVLYQDGFVFFVGFVFVFGVELVYEEFVFVVGKVLQVDLLLWGIWVG